MKRREKQKILAIAGRGSNFELVYVFLLQYCSCFPILLL